MTNMPDQCGAFLAASRIIERHQGNIVRVSYNKAVDAHALFLDVEADGTVLSAIESELNQAGFLKSVPHAKIILAQFDVPDHPGAVVPILEVLNRHHVNISYISSQSNDSGHASLKMGLYIEEPGVMDTLLRELSALCPVQILSYDSGEKKLDTTVFYLRFASEIRRLLRLTQEQTNEFTYYANLIMQELDERNEPPSKTFEYINPLCALRGGAQRRGVRVPRDACAADGASSGGCAGAAVREQHHRAGGRENAGAAGD